MITCKNDRLLELLWFVGYCIEFPTQLAVRIGGGAEWNRRVMYRAIREGYVKLYRRKHKRHVIRSLSLTQKGFDYVAQSDPEAVAMIYSRINCSERVYPSKVDKTLSLSNVTWSVERTALVGDELVPATYSAVATYSGTASSTVATGYITTAEYKGTVVSSGISSILYTVTYLGTEIVPVEEEPTFNGSIVVIPVIGGTILLATLLLLGLLLRKNTTVYKATGKGNEYEKCGRLRLKTKDPELRIDRLKDIPEGMIAVEVDQAVAKKLFGQTIAIHCYDNTVEHTVGTVNGQYWFKVDIGTQEGEPDTEEEPV